MIKTTSPMIRHIDTKKKKQLANETPEQREARLQRMRDYRARSKSVEKGSQERPSQTRQAKPGEKRATNERVRAIRANWTEEEKMEDRLKAKERMSRIRKARTFGKSLEGESPENFE